MAPIRIFVSFDGEHDADLLARLDSQLAGSRPLFALSGRSQGGAVTASWKTRVRARIRAADEMVVLCGEHTADCARMAEELRIAQKEDKPYLLVWGRREVMCTRPDGARPGDLMYSWTDDMLEQQMSATLRNAQPRVIPESLKRPPPR